jgi:hypothetical protein
MEITMCEWAGITKLYAPQQQHQFDELVPM